MRAGNVLLSSLSAGIKTTRPVMRTGSINTQDVAPFHLAHKGGAMITRRIPSLMFLGVSSMNPRRQRVFCCALLAAVLSLGTSGIVTAQQCLVSTIAFISNRDHPHEPPEPPPVFRLDGSDFEIYLMNPDGT